MISLFFITNRNLFQISTIFRFFLKIEIRLLYFWKKSKKPLIGFEPMTYALPWRYSTTELKGPYLIQFLNKELANMTSTSNCYCVYLLYKFI